MDTGNIEESILCFEKIIKLNATYLPGWYNKGLALKLLGKPEEALEHFNEAIRLNVECE